MLLGYVVIDFVWITFFMQPYFTANLGHLLRDNISTSFLLFYGSVFFIFYVGGLYWFGARPGIVANSAMISFLSGSLLGLIAYGTYGLTNYIFFKDYSIIITILDISWGAILGGSISLLGYLNYRFFFYSSGV
jgi:uncharacterized membrane protein